MMIVPLKGSKSVLFHELTKVDVLSFWAFWTFSISLKHYVPKKSKGKKNHEILKPKTTLKQKIKSRMRR